MSTQFLTKQLILCPQCVKRGCVVRDCVCGGFGRTYLIANEQTTGPTRESEIVSNETKIETETELPIGLVKDRPFLFTSLVGGVLAAKPLHMEDRRKIRVAILVRIDCEDVAWEQYSSTVRFTQFDRHQEDCRYLCRGKHFTARCRVIRDWKGPEEYCEMVAKASSELWA